MNYAPCIIWHMPQHDEVAAIYHRELHALDLCNPRQERELLCRYHEHRDIAARNTLVKKNLRFVVRVARKCAKGDTEALASFVSAGNEGLIVAADKYCPWVIPCPECDTPNYVHQTKRQRCKRCNRALRSADAKKFTTRFLTYAGWWVLEAIRTDMYRMGHAVHVPPHKIKEIQRRRDKGEDAPGIVGVPYADAADDESLTGTDALAATTLRHKTRRAIQQLPPRKAYIVAAYFGLRGDRARTLKEISVLLDICPERVRQLKEVAMRMLQGYLAEYAESAEGGELALLA